MENMNLEDRLLPVEEREENFNDITVDTPSTAHRTDPLLFNEIKTNIWGCDLLLCLFIAALKSYRADKCLRPFPSLYYDNQGKNFQLLRTTCDTIPPLETILTDPSKCPEDVAKLISWLFLQKGYPLLKRKHINSAQFPREPVDACKPHYIFEVCHQGKSEELWNKRVNGRDIVLAYHGSKIENFYSILRVGLQQHFSYEKEVLYGNGIYLSTELSVSTHYSPYGHTWNNSCLGNKHSIIAICEVINDLEKVKCKDAENKNRAINRNGFGEIPEKYFVVTDSDMVRVKYLMVYRERSTFSVKSLLFKHMFLCSMFLYLLVIVFVGIYTKSNFIFR